MPRARAPREPRVAALVPALVPALVAALALALAPAAQATAVYVSTAPACPFRTPSPWPADSDALRALATAWSHTHDVRNWHFAKERGNCSRVEYDTSVDVPNMLIVYWKKHSLFMGIEKQVCVHGRAMRETVTVQNLPFLDSLEIKVFASADPATGTVSLSAEFELALPWYLKVLDAPVQEHVRGSVREYLDILARTVCAAPGRRALREAPRSAQQ